MYVYNTVLYWHYGELVWRRCPSKRKVSFGTPSLLKYFRPIKSEDRPNGAASSDETHAIMLHLWLSWWEWSIKLGVVTKIFSHTLTHTCIGTPLHKILATGLMGIHSALRLQFFTEGREWLGHFQAIYMYCNFIPAYTWALGGGERGAWYHLLALCLIKTMWLWNLHFLTYFVCFSLFCRVKGHIYSGKYLRFPKILGSEAQAHTIDTRLSFSP